MTAPDAASLWETSAQEPDYRAPLQGDAEVDVAIVGGGYTGLSTALHCAEKGLSSHVIEAEQIGHGGSGRNVGLVNAGLWLPPREVHALLGDPFGKRFLERFGQAPERVFALIEKHQIRCEVIRNGTIHAAHGPGGLANLQARHRQWQALGAPVDLLDRAAVTRLIGTDRFHGGLVDHRCGTINPMGYCRGLARAALGAGATISTGLRATGLRRDGRRWKVETAAGVVTARSVVLATNAYTDDLWPGLRRIFTVINFFQLATRPLGPEADHILPGRQGLWDTGRIMFSLRRDAEGRLLIGSMGTVLGDRHHGLSQRFARRRIARLFPGLGPVEFEQAWHGRIAMTPDHLPRIHRLADNLYTPIGYNGRGITSGTLFGETMADLLGGADPAELLLPVTEMAPVPGSALKSRLFQSAFTANQFLKAL